MPQECLSASLTTPLGDVALEEREGAIVAVGWRRVREPAETPLLREGLRQLAAYFEDGLTAFDLPLAPAVEGFRLQVLDALRAIPFGRTRTYGEIAKELGSYGQPVGAACGANPIPIIIPCHRVLAAQGLGGFSAPGGVETKIALLKHEGAFPYLL